MKNLRALTQYNITYGILDQMQDVDGNEDSAILMLKYRDLILKKTLRDSIHEDRFADTSHITDMIEQNKFELDQIIKDKNSDTISREITITLNDYEKETILKLYEWLREHNMNFSSQPLIEI